MALLKKNSLEEHIFTSSNDIGGAGSSFWQKTKHNNVRNQNLALS